jgi:hypothetical protein
MLQTMMLVSMQQIIQHILSLQYMKHLPFFLSCHISIIYQSVKLKLMMFIFVDSWGHLTSVYSHAVTLSTSRVIYIVFYLDFIIGT